jgi:hypothetical protein
MLVVLCRQGPAESFTKSFFMPMTCDAGVRSYQDNNCLPESLHRSDILIVALLRRSPKVFIVSTNPRQDPAVALSLTHES